jgi:hypothetical protein
LIIKRNRYFGEPNKFQFFVVMSQSKINNKWNFEGSSHLMNRRGNHSYACAFYSSCSLIFILNLNSLDK